MPRLNPEKNSNKDLLLSKLDIVLPHFGTIFGLSESATAIILTAMGCMRKHGMHSAVVREGWDSLAAEFMVKDKVEVEPTRFNNTAIFYIRVGYPPQHLSTPLSIYNTHLTHPNSVIPPTSLSSRSRMAFVTTELVKVLCNSSLYKKNLGNYIITSLYQMIRYKHRLIERALSDSDSGKRSCLLNIFFVCTNQLLT